LAQWPKLGENHGGFLPFEFEVTSALKAGGPNTIVVCADNTLRRGAIWNWGGIRRPVWLEATAAVRVVRQYITPAVDLNKRTAAVGVRVLLENHGATTETVKGTVMLSAPNGYRKLLPFTARVAPRQRREIAVRTTIAPKQLHLWHFDDPYLYTSAVELARTKQTIRDRFGLRKIELDNQRYAFKLNGEAIRPMGFNLVPDDRTTGNTLPLWRIKEDVDRLKALGCNLARLVHLRLPREALDYLDERGIMTFAEVPLWGFDQFADPAQPLPKEWLERMVAEDYNHASIIGWSVANEIGDYPGAVAYSAAAIQRARQLDPSRLAVVVSHTATRNHPDPLQFSDLGLINGYGKQIGQDAEVVHRKFPDKILFFAEFGYDQLKENLDGDIDAKGMLDSLRHKPYLVGGALWTFNDYRSSYVGTRESSQNRPWGIVDVFRQPKQAYYRIRQELSPVRRLAVELNGAGATAVLTPRRALDLPAYTLTGYRLAWQATDTQGKFVQGGLQPLPTIRPAGTSLRQALPWGARSGWAQVNLALVSPLGYALYDTTLYFQPPRAPRLRSVQGGRAQQNDLRAGSGTLRVTFEASPNAASHKVRYGLQGLSSETPPTLNRYVDVPQLTFGQTYQVAVVATNGAGDSPPTPAQAVAIAPEAYAAPVVQYVEPADGGFFVGYATQADDFLFQVQYTSAPGAYASAPVLQSSTKGVLFVPHLTNGQSYFFRLRRIKDNNYASAWSDEHTVTPDGGLAPPAPDITAVLRHDTEALVALAAPVKKATGYTVHFRPTGGTLPEQSQYVAGAHLYFLPVHGLTPGQAHTFRVTAHGAAGQSAASSPTVTP
jgi:beta-galactosidase